MTDEKRKRGGDVKRAPNGYYTAKQAQERLGMKASTFRYYVLRGKIKRHIPPLKTEGYYSRSEIDRLATEMALYMHAATEETQTTETRIAQPADAQGVVEVLTVMGWQTATAEQRISWYAVNKWVDYIAIVEGRVAGYIHAVPYKPDALEGIMSGSKRSWHIQPSDILPYESGRQYDLYIGIATRKDVEHHTQRVGFRLISGFFTFLEELAEQQITIRRLYAVSDQKEGMTLSTNLGFVQLPAQEGDRFPRFMLDLQKSDSHFARLYQQYLHTLSQSD
jgi:hypothetical protein